MKACRNCGVLEERKTRNGREETNIEPTSGLCLGCLVKTVRPLGEKLAEEIANTFDGRMAAAGKDED